jgi:polyketide synthase 12
VRRAAAAVGVRAEDWSGKLAGLPAGERQRALQDLVRDHVATVLGYADSEAILADGSFKELGFDSLTAVELRNRLSSATGLRLPAALIFDYPRVNALAEYLLRRILPEGGETGEAGAIEALLRDLARLEAALSGSAIAETDRGVVTARLESLLSGWRGEPATPPRNGAATTAERLQTVSADQLLDFIDNELGAS